MSNYKVTFTAKDPCKFAGSYFRRKRFEPLVEIILARYVPFTPKYPVQITVTGNDCTINSIDISNTTQHFRFDLPTWENGWYNFDSIFAEELNATPEGSKTDRKTKKIMHIYPYGTYYFGKVFLNEVVDIHASPFQNTLVVLKEKQHCIPKHYNLCTELIRRICSFLGENSSFSFLDVVKTVLSTFNVQISQIDVLEIEGVINFYHGRLVWTRSFFNDAVVEAYVSETGYEFTCATKHSIVQKYPDGCITFKSDLDGESERDADFQEAMEKIEKTRKDVYLIPTK